METSSLLIIFVGALALIIGYFFIKNQLLKNHRSLLEAQKNETKAILSESFKSLAIDALNGNNTQFLELAKQVLGRESEAVKSELSQKKQAIDDMVKPLKETLDRYQTHLRELEAEQHRSYGTIKEELKRVIETGVALSSETRALKDALKKPHVRGRWGEIQLKNCVELSGMSEYCDVTYQDVNQTSDGRRLIPDMTVKMPGGRVVIVDSKAPLDGFLASLEASSEEGRFLELSRHGKQVKEHVRKLSSKAYEENLSESADFTVMFLPNESFLYAALETEPDLVEYALEKKILIATPPTFVGLLKVIRYGWNEERLAQNALEISEAGKELHKRLVDFVDAFVGVGRYLDRAKAEYEKGRIRLNSRVLVQAKRMEDLGVRGNKKLPEGLGEESGITRISTEAQVVSFPVRDHDDTFEEQEGTKV